MKMKEIVKKERKKEKKKEKFFFYSINIKVIYNSNSNYSYRSIVSSKLVVVCSIDHFYYHKINKYTPKYIPNNIPIPFNNINYNKKTKKK